MVFYWPYEYYVVLIYYIHEEIAFQVLCNWIKWWRFYFRKKSENLSILCNTINQTLDCLHLEILKFLLFITGKRHIGRQSKLCIRWTKSIFTATRWSCGSSGITSWYDKWRNKVNLVRTHNFLFHVFHTITMMHLKRFPLLNAFQVQKKICFLAIQSKKKTLMLCPHIYLTTVLLSIKFQ